MARLEIAVLGAFEARQGSGELISLHSRKLSGLLAFLAMSPGLGQPRETLAALLWDRSAEQQARASLRQSLAVLRKAIDDPDAKLVLADHDRVLLAPEAVRVDAVEFQRLIAEGTAEMLQRAVKLYRGRFLEGLSVASEAFDDWVRAEGQRYQDLVMGALSKLLALHWRTGAIDAAIGVAHRIFALDPLQEDAHRALIDLYLRQGTRAEALKQYDRYREMLGRELGLEPDAETRQLAERLRCEQRTPVATAQSPLLQPYPRAGDAPLVVEAGERGPPPADIPRIEETAPAYPTDRRLLTVLSCSLVDAGAMSIRLDPEDLGRVIAGFKACCEGAISRHGGHVLHHPDHAVSACFGYPRADEHASERAVSAALEIVARIGQLKALPEPGLRARIGIASGRVVVSGRVLADGVREETIAGAEPHVVAGLQAIGEPDSVLIAESTRTLLGALFEYEDLGVRKLEGITTPVRVWRVLGERSGESRFAATRGTATLAPLIGREEEIELLARRWQRAKTGAGQVVVLAGESGIGKSRLVEALRETLTDELYLHLSYYCSPHHQESALYPVIQQLERAAGYARDDPPAAKLEKLEAMLAQASADPSGEAPLIADLLSIPVGDRYPALNLAPQRQKEKTLEALDAQLVGLTRRHPALMIFEDIHWSDPSTREVLERLVECVQTLPVLMVVTHRPGSSIPQAGEPHVTSLVLKRLRRSESEALVAKLAGERGLPKDVLAQIVDKADGVPLFIEELTKNALEAGVLGNRSVGDAPGGTFPSATGVPDTLHDLLVARLDRLGTAKAAAQEAAVIGRRFPYALLAAISTLKEPELQLALASLADSELVYAHGTPPHATYSFKHALVQDAAYASLLRTDRAPLHERIAKALEARFPETKEIEPEVLAHHFAGAGLKEKAVFYWQKAGELAMRRSALREAIAYLGTALGSLKMLPQSAERSGQELALQVLYGQAWMLGAGYTAPEVEAAYARARDLCEEIGDSNHLFFVLLGLWQLYIAREELARASRTADQLLPLALGQDNRDFMIEAHVAQLVTAYTQGAFEKTLAHANEAIALNDPEAQHRRIQSFGYDGRVIALTGAAWALWILGYPDQAVKRAQEALGTARKLAHPYTQSMALYSCGWLHLFRREASAARELAEQAITLSIEHGFPWPRAYAAPVGGWALAEEGRTAEGIEMISGGLAALKQMGHGLWRPHQQGLLAAACARAGRHDEALAAVTEALDTVSRTGDQENAAELHRLNGELALQLALPQAAREAERCFRSAIEIARRQQAKSWELRAATSLARLWRDQGTRVQARDLLAPVYGWFTEGFDTADLQDARALLETLA